MGRAVRRPQKSIPERMEALSAKLYALIPQLPGPLNRQLATIAVEFEAIRADLIFDGEPEVPSDVPPAPSNGKPRSSPRPEPSKPAKAPAVLGRVVGTCPECGKPVVRRQGVPGRNPLRCEDCRNRPTDGKAGSQAANAVRYAKAHPTPKTRICARCRVEKPLSEFNAKNPKTGNVHAWCRECQNARSRERYLRVGQTAVTVELCEGDDAVGAACPKCNRPLAVGETVRGHQLRHVRCPGATVPTPA